MFGNFLVIMVPLKQHEFKRKFKLHESSHFQWLQLIDSIPERWKFIIKENYENATILFIHEAHHLIISIKVIVFN